MLRPIFTITIFTSAFLLFLVQPMIGKLILPKLGGTPQVWNTCMVFFQMALLLGYGYTHVLTTKLKLRQILVLHCGMLLIPIALLFLFPMYTVVHNWSPPTEGTPVGNTLGVLALIIGVPFLLASTSAPILIRWFAYSGDPAAKDPYFLYAVSNAGSLSALFFYPALEEPFVILPNQTYIWVGGFITLSLLICCCAFSIFKVAPPDEQLAAEAAASPPPPETPAPEAAAPAPAPVVDASTAVKSGHAPATRGIQRKKGMKVPGRADDEHDIHKPAFDVNRGAKADMTWARRIRWVLLAAVPSSLMLGVTSYISTDLSPFPLVWIIPLALYLISFILVYLKAWTGHRLPLGGGGGYTVHQIIVYVAQPLGALCLCIIVLRRGFDPFYATSAAMLGFFANALACHGELAEDRPSTKHLTEYFLLMSVGGAVGGILNGIIAPLLFQSGVLEFYIAIVIACFVRPQYVPSGWFDELVLSAFPGLRGWFSNQGDEMAKSMGRAPQHSTYMFSLFLDIVFGAFVLSIAYALKTDKWEVVGKAMRFIGMGGSQFGYSLIVFGIPALFCFFFAGTPLRFGLAVFGFLFGSMYLAEQARDDSIVPGGARRTYFGVLRVMKDTERAKDPEEKKEFTQVPWFVKDDGETREISPVYSFHYLMHGTTYHGRNYLYDPGSDMGKHFKDISRLATTYYHRYGPVGAVMERDNWFPGPQNSFWADNRMPTTIVGQIAAGLGAGTLPLPAMVETWSEPPFATIGLGTGTMVSYARPYQHMTYYEIDEVIREFSLPKDPSEDGLFTYLQSAIRRGVNLEVVMGDARQSLAREKDNLDNAFVYSANFTKNLSKFKSRTYSKVPYEVVNRKSEKVKDEDGKVLKDKDGKDVEANKSTGREGYYRAINVDAFSSDAIPVHLVTLQAIKLYMEKLSENGVLCVHTSNRHMDLVRPVARIALELKLDCIVGKDRMDKGTYMGHFSSEYVMIFRKYDPDGKDKDKPDLTFAKYVADLQEEKDKLAGGNVPNGRQILNSDVQWYDPYKDHTEVSRGHLVKRPINMADSLWTDDYSFILGVLR